MNVSDELLIAYTDGELDAAEARRIEAQAATDPALAERINAHRNLRARLAAAFGGAMDEPAPDRLLKVIQGPPATVIDLAARRAQRETPKAPAKASIAVSGAMAACLVVGVIAGRFMPQTAPAMIRNEGGAMVAGGRLDHVLTTQLASDPAAASQAVRVGVSFRTAAGGYCRTFQIDAKSATAGLACREDGAWRVKVATETGGGATRAEGGYRMAASETPAAVTAAMSAMIAGEPLDAKQEAAARSDQWRAASGRK